MKDNTENDAHFTCCLVNLLKSEFKLELGCVGCERYLKIVSGTYPIFQMLFYLNWHWQDLKNTNDVIKYCWQILKHLSHPAHANSNKKAS